MILFIISAGTELVKLLALFVWPKKRRGWTIMEADDEVRKRSNFSRCPFDCEFHCIE